MQFILISIDRVIQKHLLIQFGSQFLIVEYLGGYYVYRFKVNYIYQHGDYFNFLHFAQNQHARAILTAAFLLQI